MKKMIAPLLLLLSLGSQTVYADAKNEASSSFWDKLRSKIEQIVPQKKVSATTAVGGVRGAKLAADDVYWKGEKVTDAVDAEDLDEFKAAMALAAAGDLARAQTAFAEFVKKNPDSPLRKDADQALTQLQASK
jgi:TolA-binding protein